MSPCRITPTFGAAVGGLLSAAFLTAAVAFADDDTFTVDGYTLTLDPATYQADEDIGVPPMYQDLVASEEFNVVASSGDSYTHGIYVWLTELTSGPITNDNYFVAAIFNSGITLPHGTEIDTFNLGFGFENEWIDVSATSTTAAAITDVFMTPFGDITF